MPLRLLRWKKITNENNYARTHWCDSIVYGIPECGKQPCETEYGFDKVVQCMMPDIYKYICVLWTVLFKNKFALITI